MATVTIEATMSLDGFVADSDGIADPLFEWCFNGPVETPIPNRPLIFRTQPATAEYMRDVIQTVGALVIGRRQYDIAKAWQGTHPFPVPVFVVTHNPPANVPEGDTEFVFVTEGVEAAINQAKLRSNNHVVMVAGGQIAGQALDLDLVDNIRINLVPLVFGSGLPFFGDLVKAPKRFKQTKVVVGDDVTHLVYSRI